MQSVQATVHQMTISAIHDMDTSNNDNFALTACILHTPTVVRWIQVPDKNSGDKEQVCVLAILLADHTGPIIFELWRKQAEYFLNLISVSQSCCQNTPTFISIKYFIVRSANRPKAEFIVPTKKSLAVIVLKSN